MTAVAPTPFQSGYRLLDGQGVDNELGYPTYSAEDNITASATQTQAAAYQLTAQLSRVVTVAAGGNGVALPAAKVGKSVVLVNSNVSNAVQVFGMNGTTDTINGTAGSTGISQAAASRHVYECFTAGAWIEF